MEADRIKWNKRFLSEDSFLGMAPSPFLQRKIEDIKLLTPGLHALDIACGEGRNSIFLAQHGFNVTGLDISDVALGKAGERSATAGISADFRLVDLESYRFEGERYDLVINFNFLLRELIPEAYSALVPGGIFLLDTILESPEALANHTPAYLLRRGELASIFDKLDGKILFIEEVTEGQMPTARVLFKKV
ncbi:class I SAM-dependent methyltransferase [Pelotalea chapellei]|uniref:Methyltransferase domain-containing protein n=1 Tax=Pelotalea chapellei TaxID=44671 RepID=A0ABS5U7R7_9BACT|nr:class I SAM-dependent methyltransferase [Pelotalea chapellei]MBT1071714.1 methyltransferase domain-containing protein [Pelotalea chapellei]